MSLTNLGAEAAENVSFRPAYLSRLQPHVFNQCQSVGQASNVMTRSSTAMTYSCRTTKRCDFGSWFSSDFIVPLTASVYVQCDFALCKQRSAFHSLHQLAPGFRAIL